MELMYRDKRLFASLLGYYAVIAIVMIVTAQNFFTRSNLNSIFRSTATTLVAAMGMMLVLLVGEIDVSVGSILAMCCVVSGKLALTGIPLLLNILICLCVGAVMGLINGLVVNVLRLHSIVATLGMLSIYRGLRIAWTGGIWITGFPESFLVLGQGEFLGINISIYVAFAVLIVVYIITMKTAFGRDCYAIGSNEKAARWAGIKVKMVKIAAFTINGLLVGLSAVMYTSRFGSVQSNTGNGWEMTVITAAVIGGTSTLGGEGNALSVALGAILVSALNTLLVFLGIDSLWEEAVQGIIILLSVCTYSIKLPKLIKNRKGDSVA
jgi:ribose/xylose/arabinose/galactoside ABC-type transport system permease subunit